MNLFWFITNCLGFLLFAWLFIEHLRGKDLGRPIYGMALFLAALFYVSDGTDYLVELLK